jgi:hypothetical protein
MSLSSSLTSQVQCSLVRHKSGRNGSPDTINTFNGDQELALKIFLHFEAITNSYYQGAAVIFPGRQTHIFYWTYNSLTHIEKSTIKRTTPDL